jgi:hypothetical protein
MTDLIAVLKDFGPLVGTILFFIWRDWRREENLVERVKQLEDFNTEVLTQMVKEMSGIIAANTEQLRLVNLVSEVKAQINGQA